MFYLDVSGTFFFNHSEISDHIECFVNSLYTEQYNRRAKLGALHLILLMRMGIIGEQIFEDGKVYDVVISFNGGKASGSNSFSFHISPNLLVGYKESDMKVFLYFHDKCKFFIT